MKTTFTSFILKSFTILLFVTGALSLAAQTTHQVTVTDGQFTPKDLTINAGDKVVWTNTGTNGHNVNGTQATFPSNPESFGNEVGLNWTYEHVFSTAGQYDYQCDPHAAFGMVGTVTVNPATDADVVAEKSFSLYPNPASEYIQLLLRENNGLSPVLKIYSVNGKLIEQKVLPQSIQSYRYDLHHLKNGLYFMKVTAGNKTHVAKFHKQ